MKIITLEGKSYKFDADEVRLSELFVIQAQTGLRLRQWQEGLGETDPAAVRSLIYMLKARAGENPDWDEIDFSIADLDVVDEDKPDPQEAEASSLD